MNIGIIGYGKMGKEVEKMAIKKGHQIIYKINSKNQHILSERNTPKVDVAIEFSQPDSACKNINLCINNKTPVVCGTTGWANHISKVEKLCLQKNSTFLYAPNFSIGMNLFFEISNYMSKLMMGKNYNPLIEEKHHKMKQDIPSGTAIKIAHDIYENYKTIHQTQKTPIKSKRIGKLKGEHIVKYISDIDEIKISHKAYNRRGFAEGAILAAEFIKNKKGVFRMTDVISNL